MRLKDHALKKFLRGHIAAEMMKSYMDIPNPFSNGENMVVTGSSTTYYNWHFGLSDVYAYKPPTDLDLVLSVPPERERSTDNIRPYRNMMLDATSAAAENSGFESTVTMRDQYDARILVTKTFEPEEVKAILGQQRIAGVLLQMGVNDLNDLKVDSPIASQIPVDLLALNPGVLKTRTFGAHPNAETGLLRREDPSASMAFKMARSFLGKHRESDYPKPGDLIDMFNTLHTDGYVHDPKLLRVIAVVSTALQVDGQFDFKTRGLNRISGGTDPFREAVREAYGSRIDKKAAESILQTWQRVAREAFPEIAQGKEDIFKPQEVDFIMNFSVPQSGEPSNSIAPELLEQTPEGQEAFRAHPEMKDNIKNSTFMQQRVTFMQISPQEIAL